MHPNPVLSHVLGINSVLSLHQRIYNSEEDLLPAYVSAGYIHTPVYYNFFMHFMEWICVFVL